MSTLSFKSSLLPFFLLVGCASHAYGQTCRPGGDRCMGATDFPYVPWIPCCSGDCSKVISGKWGTFCNGGGGSEGTPKTTAPPSSGSGVPLTPKPPSPGKCHANYVRCAGAPNKPFVEWKPCCEEGSVCSDAPDWGQWCKPPTTGSGTPDAKCHANGVRCAGAPGKPFVQWKPCCETNAQCQENAELGWGSWCVGSGIVITTTTTTSTTTAAKGTDTTMTTLTTSQETSTATLTSSTTDETTTTTTDQDTTTTTTNNPDDVCEGFNSVRPDVTTMSDQEWNDYAEAVNLLREEPGTNDKSVLENFAQIHAEFGKHRDPYFLPWHRAFLWEFEKALDSVKPGTRIPIYDWSVVSLSPLTTQTFSPSRMGGSVGVSGNDESPIPNGPFQGLYTRIREDGADRPVTRNFDTSQTMLDRGKLDNSLSINKEYGGFTDFLEGVHDSFHRMVGGSMRDGNFSPEEPMFFLHHAMVDKTWREWQQLGNGNQFGGSLSNGSPASLDEEMKPFGRTVRDILEGISGCVQYTDAASRPAFEFPVGSRQSGAEVSTGEKKAPKNTEAAGKESAYISEAPATVPKLESREKKVELLKEVAKRKVADPEGYRQEVLIENQYLYYCLDAMEERGASASLLDEFKKMFALVELYGAVDLTDVDEVYSKKPEEIAEDGRTEEEALNKGDDAALPEKKIDLTGEKSDVSVAVEGA